MASPGVMRVYMEQYGCALNRGESDRLRWLLLGGGAAMVSRPSEADVCIIDTCMVIEHTERRMLRRIRQLAQQSRNLIVTGCLATVLAERIGNYDAVAVVAVPPDKKWEIPRMLGLNTTAMAVDCKAEATIPIATGCLGNCKYCITRLARGRLRSRAPSDIASDVLAAVSRGARIVKLASQDSVVYGWDIGYTLWDLIAKVTEIGEEFYIRIGMMNPQYAVSHIDNIVDIYREKKVLKFLHLPVQSGSDKVLTMMNRGYCVEEFENFVAELRNKIADLCLVTDMIVGYPGEKNDDFMMSCELLRRVRPDNVNITRFSPRPKTEAAALPRPHGRVAKARSRYMTALVFSISYSKNLMYVGRRLDVIVTAAGKNRTLMARAMNYKPVVLPGTLGMRSIGSKYAAKITAATSVHLCGEVSCCEQRERNQRIKK